jgi:hypothetical protein
MNRQATSLCLVLLLAQPLYAHHGNSSQFDQSKSLEVSGVVTKIRFVNPHSYVYFDVTTDSGEVQNWRCEMQAASVLKRSGWSADMFPTGTRIRIEGAPARREPHGCYVERFNLDEGEVIQRYQELEGAETIVSVEDRPATLANGQPNFSGDWAMPQRQGTARPAPPGSGSPEYELTAAGKVAVADFDLNRDNPRFHCKAVNIFADWTFDRHVNRIEQTDNTVTLKYGFMDIVRVIHLDMDGHPANITPSRAGHSIGKWEGNTLVVDTTGFSVGYLEGRDGVMHSAQLHAVEKFTLDPAEGSITRRYVGDDPLYLVKAVEKEDKVYLTSTTYEPYNCDDLTNELVEGF